MDSNQLLILNTLVGLSVGCVVGLLVAAESLHRGWGPVKSFAVLTVGCLVTVLPLVYATCSLLGK